MKEIIDVYGRKLTIDETARKLYLYDNSKKRAVYNAPVVENGERTTFWTDYVENEVITDVEARLRVFGSHVLFYYAKLVGFRADINDPDKKLWDKLVNYVKENEDKFFFKNGNLKKYVMKVDENLNIITD